MHNRFFCKPEDVKDNLILISDKKEIHHIVNVLRFNRGDKVVVFDGRGKEFDGAINKINKNEVEISIMKITEKNKRPFNITLACAIPKKVKFDFIVEKATELGVKRIIPLKTKRTEVVFDERRLRRKLDHWRQIAINATKQSDGVFITQIDKLKSFSDAMSEINEFNLMLLPTLEGERKNIVDEINSFQGREILVFIGPEGDFTQNEVKLALREGCKLVSLGERVLKVDTAAISVISVINNILESRK